MSDSMYVLQLGAKSVVFSYMCGWELDGNVKVQQKPLSSYLRRHIVWTTLHCQEGSQSITAEVKGQQ